MIRTGENSWAELRFENDGVARIGPHSSFTFKNGRQKDELERKDLQSWSCLKVLTERG